MSSSPCCSLFLIQNSSQHALESPISHRPYKSQFLGLRLKMWLYFLTYKCHRLSTLTSTCDTLYGKHIFLLPSAPFLGPCGQIDRSKKEQRDLVALNFFTRHDLYSWKSFIDRYFHFFLSETEIIVPNTGGETLNGKTYWHLGLLKWACTHTQTRTQANTLWCSQTASVCRGRVSTRTQLSPVKCL